MHLKKGKRDSVRFGCGCNRQFVVDSLKVHEVS
jgi:hypothetical protein